MNVRVVAMRWRDDYLDWIAWRIVLLGSYRLLVF